MPGPSRKPDGRRQRRNQKPFEVVRLADHVDPPDLPDTLSDAAADLWDRYWRSDVARAANDADLDAVERWCAYANERRRLTQVLQQQYLVEGSQGQPVLNPIAARLRDLESWISDLEKQLGLTPKARADLGLATATAGNAMDTLTRRMQDVMDVQVRDDPFEEADVDVAEEPA